MKIDEDTLIAYALGALSSEEEREVAQYLREHPEAAAQVQEFFDTLTAFAMSNEPEPLPADAEEQLLTRIRQTPLQDAGAAQATPEHMESDFAAREVVAGRPDEEPIQKPEPHVLTMPPRRNQVWWLGLAAAVAIAVIAYVGLMPYVRVYQAERQLDQICAQAQAQCHTVTDAEGRTLGTVAVRPDNSVLAVFEAPPTGQQVYQAWEIVDGAPRSLGVWQQRVMNKEHALASGSAFGVTVEPPGGSQQPTSEPIVVVQL
jgi:anti-sigma-K factor RskA